jgi:Ca2+-transporting ATPase
MYKFVEKEIIMNFWNRDILKIEKELNTNIEKGLSSEEVSKKRAEFGVNEIEGKKKQSFIIKFLNEFKDFMIIVLIIAAIVSGYIGIREGEGITDSIIILIVVIMNAIIGVVQESKAEKSLEALQKMSAHVTKVIRNGNIQIIEAKDIVVGDVVILDTGDYVPADLRLIETVNLKVQESALTRRIRSNRKEYRNNSR